MFTDNPVTPVRLEILLDLLRGCRQGLARDDAYRLLQPEPLAGGEPSFTAAKATIRAGVELELVKDDGDGISLAPACRKEQDTRASVLSALDEHVLSKTDVEKYFALFAAYYLGLGKQVYERRSQDNQTWANQFNRDVFENTPQPNPFNGTKLTGLHRWFGYAGLGWYDPAGKFQANPYDRLRRALPAIFKRHRKLESEDFMFALSQTCPDLDGGAVFEQANRGYKAVDKRCTLGLSHALVELHLDGTIQLSCPADSNGWNVEEAEPPGNATFLSTKFASVQLMSND